MVPKRFAKINLILKLNISDMFYCLASNVYKYFNKKYLSDLEYLQIYV